MKILVISNLYPPHYIGGYELGCRDVVRALKARGHQVKVLTSTYGLRKPESDGQVYRWLEPQINWKRRRLINLTKLIRKELNNQRALKHIMRSYQPDVIYVWNLTLISVSLALLAQKRGARLCYFVSDDWLSRWDQDSWYRFWWDKAQPWRVRLARAILRPFLVPFGIVPLGSLDLQYVHFASRYLQRAALEAGKAAAEPEVIPWGVDTSTFSYKERCSDQRSLLYVGQLMPHKGVHTIIEAMKILVKEYGCASVELTLVGGTTRPDYLADLQTLVGTHSMDANVRFAGWVSRERLPRTYLQHEILLFPSAWEEPFSITLLEAMSCGLAVVGTATGGSSEVLEHEVNALIFPKEDARACANHVRRLLDHPLLFERIRKNGRRVVEDRFRLETMTDRIERTLLQIAASASS